MVPVIDPSDDSQWRWVVFHYRFDPTRRERRNTVVAAYDNEAEYSAAIDELSERVRTEIASGSRDAKEHVSGVIWNPGYHAEQARGRVVRSAVDHGVDPRPLLRDGPLPSNVSVFGVDDDGQPWHAGGDEPPQPPLSRSGWISSIWLTITRARSRGAGPPGGQ